MKHTKKWFSLALALVIMFAFAACSSGNGGTSTAGNAGAGSTRGGASGDDLKDTVVFCQGNDISSLDGSVGRQERAVSLTNHIFDPLFIINLDYELEGCLATGYEWVDDTSLKVTLREGVKFHDGSDMTAEDVVFTMDLMDERGAVLLGNYAGCDIEDDYTVVIKLKDPDPALPNVLSMPQTCILPSDAYDPAAFAVNPIGTGPYKMKEFAEGDYYTVERFDDYWGEKAKTQYLTLRIVPEPSQRTILLETGEVDIATQIPINDIKRIEQEGNLNVLTCPSMKVVLMELNCDSGGPVGDPLVRRAIECAIDKETIVNTLLEGYCSVATSIVSPHAVDYRATAVNDYDPDLARSLLADAGYTETFDVTLFTNSDQTNGEIAQVMQSQLAEVGINLIITIQDDNTTYAMVENGDEFDLILDFYQALSGHVNFVFNGAFFSTALDNYSRYYSDEFDETYLAYSTTPEGPEREALLEKIYEILQRDTPAIGLYLENKMVVTRKGVEGVTMSCIGAHEYQYTTATKP